MGSAQCKSLQDELSFDPKSSAQPELESDGLVHPPVIETTANSLDEPTWDAPVSTNSDVPDNAPSIIFSAFHPSQSAAASAAPAPAGDIASFIGQGLGISSMQLPAVVPASPTNAIEAMTASSTLAVISSASGSGLTNVILPGTTLTPGQSATVSGITVVLPSAGSGILVNGESTDLPQAASNGIFSPYQAA